MMACVLIVSACDEKKSDKPKEQTSAEQAEILKYNAYVEAANMAQVSWAEPLENFTKYVQPVLEGQKKNDHAFMGTEPGMVTISKQLTKALAMEPAMATLDGPATAYRDALSKASPAYNDMADYIAAKTYLSDKGARGRELEGALLQTMQALVKAQDDFEAGIEAEDRARLKAALEKAPKDSIAHDRLGLIYNMKQAMSEASGFFNGNGLGDQKDAFKASIDQVGSLSTSLNAKMREQNGSGCTTSMLQINAFLSTGRDVVERTENGTYAKEDKNPPAFQMIPPASRSDAKDLLQNFNNVIGALNQGGC